MKSILLSLLVLASFNVKAENIRDLCEKEYNTTGSVKLHEYKLTINWAHVSDNYLKLLEDTIYGDHFVVTKETDLLQKTIYEIKEIDGFETEAYNEDLAVLNLLSANKLECLKDL